MTRPCEVCSSLLVQGQSTPERTGRMRRVLVGRRVIALCDAHARAARDEGIDDVDALQRFFSEGGGQRSLLDRRSPLDRRVFPPRPEGRRRNHGRRDADPIG